MHNRIKGKFYLSDEGFGHIVRQSAILEELQKKCNISAILQTKNHLSVARKLMPKCSIHEIFNNICWHKKKDGSPDLIKIREYYSNYLEIINKWKQNDMICEDEKNHLDFIVSDFVYEAFYYGKKVNVPTFGVCHFTWDWFFSKLYPPVLNTKTMNYFLEGLSLAEKIYFPPFTPPEIIEHLGDKAEEVPFIVRKVNGFPKRTEGDFKVLLMDSGSGLLSKSIEKALEEIIKSTKPELMFYISSSFEVEAKNVRCINKDELLVDYIPQMDLVIGRAGFNTISECIAYRTPMLLISEAMNPEMNENIVQLKKSGLGSFMSTYNFETNLIIFLNSFLRNEYSELKNNMGNHQLATNGAEYIADSILKRTM